MNLYLASAALCIFPGILSCAIHEILRRRQLIKAERPATGAKTPDADRKASADINYLIKTAAFYAMIFFTILALFKTLLGNGAFTLIESFDEISGKTYLHYSLPLIVLAVCLPFVIRMLLRNKTDEFIRMSLSTVIMLCAIAHLVFSRINNGAYLCIAALGAALSLGSIYAHNLAGVRFYKMKKDGSQNLSEENAQLPEAEYCTRKNLKARLKAIMPVMLFWVVLMVLYLPNELYLGNTSDMSLPYGIFAAALLAGGLAYFVIYTAASVYFLNEKHFYFLCEIIFAVTLASYIQGIALNGKMEVMEGGMQTWPVMTKVVNALIWLAIIGAVIALKYVIKSGVYKIYSMVCIYISLILLVSWGYLGFSADLGTIENEYELTTLSRLELDRENNVLVFVLDWFDVQVVDKMLDEDEHFLEPLNDFTWYKNMTSAYAYTAMSLPYLLTGVEWRYDMEETLYRDYAFENSTFIEDIAAHNYDVGIYTSSQYVSPDLRDIVVNYADVSVQGWDYGGIVQQMLKCSKYKSYPFAIKSRYWYTDGDLFRVMRSTSVHNTADDTFFYDDLSSNGIKIRSTKKYDGAFRFYHLNSIHPPISTDMVSQGRWSFEFIYEYLEQLKQLGLYEGATIIITADHGQNYFDERLLEYDLHEKASSPILFVKKANRKNEDGLQISMAPVSHMEMAASIMEAVCGDTLGYGETFEDINEDSERPRYFIYRYYGYRPYTKYEIDGYAGDWDNWTMVETDNVE